jgi:hypothetical protein
LPSFVPNVVRRLSLARYQIARARLQLVNATEFSAWQAAIALHDAADIAVLAIADQLGIPRKKRRFMHEFPDLIEKQSGKPFFDRPLIEEDLSEVRNPAKHRGGFPGVTDVLALAERQGESGHPTPAGRRLMQHCGVSSGLTDLPPLIHHT